jgi:zinc transport system permease protein
MDFYDLIYRMASLIPYEWAHSTFIIRAAIGLALLTPVCGAMGIMVVNYRMAFFSDTISHSAFTGVAIGLLIGINPWLSLVIFGVFIGLGIVRVKRHSELSTDTIIGVFFSTVIAIGIAVISVRRGLNRDLQSYLFGDILTINESELTAMIVLFLIAAVYIWTTYNRLLFIGLHEDLAFSKGLKTILYEYSFASLLAIVVTFSIRAVGLLLVTAMLILPAASARNIARSSGAFFWWSIVFAFLSGLFGLIGSLLWNIATGASVILIASVFFLITSLWSHFSPKGSRPQAS